MAYILKKTSGLINTRVTDAARQKMSQGNFNISYFQVGDSEVSYNILPTTYNQSLTKIFEPAFNSQNTSGEPESNKQNIKYPYYVDGITGNTYGIPYMDSTISPVFNRATMRGFFTGNITAETISWSALTNNQYVINSNYVVSLKDLDCSNEITLIYAPCNHTHQRGPYVGDFVTIFYDGKGMDNCYCTNLPTPTPTPTPSSSSSTSTTTTTTQQNSCTPTATPTPSSTPCITPSASRICPLPPPPDCKVGIESCYMTLTYRIVAVCDNKITLDRPTPNLTWLSGDCYGRVIIYPPNINEIYDSYTPRPHWDEDVINYESVNTADEFDVKIWNMNIPWSENPAGLISSTHKDYTNFGSISYLGTKEYLGYASSIGQTDTDYVYYYNSFDEKIEVTPEEQKAIAVIHYTNQTIDFFYGEKFALEPYDPSNPDDTTGQARNFKLHIPWLMWHKNPNCCNGQTFWVDPPGFDDLTKEGSPLFKVHYLESTKNIDMNSPGIRYYHLWDNNPNSDGLPSRIGKVFPDQKVIIIDDEEIIAAMSYKSNRNWTLPAPKISLITPNICGDENALSDGLLSGNTEYLHVTYRFTNTGNCINSLHCNYYSVLEGPNINCLPITSQNVAVRFGDEFPCLTQGTEPPIPPCYCWSFTASTEYNPYSPNIININYVNCDGINESKAVTFNEKESPIFSGLTCSITEPTSDDDDFIVEQLGLCEEVEGCDTKRECFCFIIYRLPEALVEYTNCTFTNCSGVTETIGVYDQGTICSYTVPIFEAYGAFAAYPQEYGCDDVKCVAFKIPECKCWEISSEGLDGETFEVSYIDCEGNEIVDSFLVNQSYLVCSKTVPTSSASQFYVSLNDISCENCQFSEFELRPFGDPIPTTTTTTTCPIECDIYTGFYANKFEIICQKVDDTGRPNSSEWRVIDYTSQLSATTINGFITKEGLISNTFVITKELYDSAPTYNLNNYIPLTEVGYTGTSLNFGDEYYFYGSLESDIESTIYEMRYKINLGQAEFKTTSNPTWTQGTKSYVTEIALYDSDKTLMILSKLQSPVLRQGIQQFLVKLDF